MSELGGRRVVASISGGKDSAAMSLHLCELGVDHDRVFMDTGWEVFPMQRYLRAREDEGELVNAVGIRAAESEARSKMTEWEWSDGFDCETWRPILRWTEEEVVAIHKRHGLRPNPLYLMGASRVGCWPCIYARKDEIRLIADKDPGRIDLLRALEEQVAGPQRRRALARWLELPLDERVNRRGAGERPFPNYPSWFQAPLGDTGETWPIDKVVQWSRTSRGGRQLEIFAADPADAGCMRWGLCETESP